MVYAVTQTFRAFHPKSLLPDALRLTLASAAVLLAGLIASRVPLPAVANGRWLAVLDLAKISLACLVAAWPALVLTKSVTGAEGRTLLGIVLPRKVRPEPRYVESVT
jgi:hypothetical protein